MFKFILCLGKKYEGLIENFFSLFLQGLSFLMPLPQQQHKIS